ncbi:hypothetical protein Lesp02_68490 [Lentzea sp. NBRC 105346]|uniref:hypothetical protein n=1 Tax=Lentzea sp. NBRC 105346 TaxID=3032205 RepID=UPI0024A198C8|nr:hypothetical protein [Lentzea sp. NBRC 105346]GLZ34662.1 hypothetical protein Lesp02_68490 [Lentzea sp. NBRC 105346]
MTFAPLIVGALGGDPRQALPVAEISALWRAGVELLDDLRAGRPHRSARRDMATAIACLTRLPQDVIDETDLPCSVRDDWRVTFAEASVAALNGESGVLHAAEATMAARLVTDDPQSLRSWHTFGLAVGHGLLVYARTLLIDLVDASPYRDELLRSIGAPAAPVCERMGRTRPENIRRPAGRSSCAPRRRVR